MEKTYKPSIDMWQLDTDADHILHRKGDEDFNPIRHAMVKPDDVDAWEEIAVADIPPYTEEEYKAKVKELVHKRYSLDDEIALINNITAGVTEKRQSEYAAYQEYREECKRMAKEILSTENTGNDNG